MTSSNLLQQLNSNDQLTFSQVIEKIKTHYNYTPTHFTNNKLQNPAGTNQGSCIIFAFAKLHQLTDQQTLQLFREHYQTVLATPHQSATSTNHLNIRQFIKTGLAAVDFSDNPLTQKL